MSSTTVPVILASASPRRRDLLSMIGITHVTRAAEIDESVQGSESPPAHAERLAIAKANAVAARAAHALVLAADTIVVIGNDILGKPRDEAQAAQMLARLSGRTHTVVTAVAASFEGVTYSAVERVAVTFRPLDAPEIDAYIATGEPMDKAGGYGIQGYGATIVERIDGDYFAVMGLPIVRLLGLCRRLGFTYGPKGLERVASRAE